MLIEQDLKKLRYKQIIIQNIMYFLLMGLVAIFLIFIKSLKAFSFMAGAVCLSSFIIGMIIRKRGELIEIIVPSMKPLFDYERDRLGVEYWILRKRQLIIQPLLAVMMFFQGITMPNNTLSVYDKPDLHILLSIALLMLAVLNISSYFHIRKVDKSNTELKGYANKTMLYGIIGGIVLSGLITFTILASFIY
ncbi:MAG: hypothetical protein ACYDEJ_15320 [Desulfitobacteriaceae bacterium]